MSDKVYDKAWKLLCDPSKWCQNHYAKSLEGSSVRISDPEAISWCTVGAIYKVYGDKASTSTKLDLLIKYLKGMTVSAVLRWNDKSKHADVLNTLKQLDI